MEVCSSVVGQLVAPCGVCSVCVAHGTQGGPLFMHKVTVSHCPA